MATTIEVKYFNSFWLKKLKTITDVNYIANAGNPTQDAISANIVNNATTITLINNPGNTIFVGQVVSYTISSAKYSHIITKITTTGSDTTITINTATTAAQTNVSLSFSGTVPNTMQTQTQTLAGATQITLRAIPKNIGIGQSITYQVANVVYTNSIKSYSGGVVITLRNPVGIIPIPAEALITFGEITELSTVPSQYSSDPKDWAIEEARINGGYNNTSVDFGVRAYLAEDSFNRVYFPSSLIYSGVFNSRTGINNTNQFPVGEDLTKSVTPSEGSIQKLYAEDTNLTIFQEKKVSMALIDKNAIYSAEGSPVSTTSNVVIGPIKAYAGNYGIGTNPESFATYGYRKYFTDAPQNAVLRLSQDGITEISDYGMLNYFRNSFSTPGVSEGFIKGMYDMHTGQYVLSIQGNRKGNITPYTVSFDEDYAGWVSFFDYIPDHGLSLNNDFYTFKNGSIYIHYSNSVPKSFFYGVPNKSTATLIFNPNVSVSKSFLTINYEGTSNWELTSLYTDTDTSAPVAMYDFPNTPGQLQDQLFSNNFKRKQNKYFANTLNITSLLQGGEILYGQSMSGIKGFFATATFSTDNSTIVSSNTSLAELYAVSSEYIESSY